MPKRDNANVNTGLWVTLAMGRVAIGFIFLWAFFDKLFGLGYSTPLESAWIHGGSPTAGYLGSLTGVFSPFFRYLIDNILVDWVFMLGLAGVGIGLMLGIAMRLSILSAVVMLYLMWLTLLPLSANPLISDHIIYIALLIALWFAQPYQRLSIGRLWQALPFVKRNAWLK